MSEENNSKGLISKEAKIRSALYMALKSSVAMRAMKENDLELCVICMSSNILCECDNKE